MLCVSSFQTQSDSQKASNSQSAQSTFPTFVGDFSSITGRYDGPQGSSLKKLMNQNHLGAKRALSEPNNSQKLTTSSRFLTIESCTDMQTSVHKMDTSSRYNNNSDMSSSHIGQGSFMNGNSSFHSGESGSRVHNQNSYGAQYSSQAEKAKSQGYNCENNGNSESPYSGWQGLNASVSSSSSNNGWNIPDGSSTIGRSIHVNHESLANAHDENMVVDNDGTFPNLLGATGGVDSYGDDKSNGCNNFLGNSRSMHMPRLGLLGGGENSLTSQSSGWNGSQGATSSVSGWGGRQNNGVSDSNPNPNSENMVVESEMSYTGMMGASGGTEGKQNSGNNSYRQETSIPPPRTGLAGGGEGNVSAPLNGWGNSGNSTPGWGASPRPVTNVPVPEISGATGSGSSPSKPQGSWAQAAGKGLNPAMSGNGGQSATTSNEPPTSEAESLPTAKDRAAEETQELLLKAAFSEGWGIPNSVNQDTPWDFAPSPPLEPGKENPAMWRAPVNNGTEIWENNLRMNKGASTATPAATVPPWGHTPATNIGGHWGDDDTSNNMWNGAPPNNMSNPTNWADPVPTPSNSNMWNSNQSEKHWAGNQQSNTSWNDNSGGSDNGTAVWNAAAANKGRNWSPMATPKKEMPVPGWEPPSPTTNRRPPSGNNMGGANNMPPSNMSGMQMSGSGMVRFPPGANSQKMDMPVEMWSNKKPPPNNRLNWQDMPSHRENAMWAEDSHSHNQMKQMGNSSSSQGGPYNPGWNEQGNNPLSYWGAKPKSNSNWADGQVDTSSWLGPTKQRGEMMQEGWSAMSEEIYDNTCSESDNKKDNSFGYWNEDKSTPQPPFRGWVGRKLKGGKPLCRDLIWASKQFRLLIELGFKKDEVENALRNNNMAFEEALNELRSGVSMDNNMMEIDNFGGRKMRPATANEDMSIADHNIDTFPPNNFHGQGGFQAMNYPAAHSYKQVNKCSGSNSANMNLINAHGGQSSIGSIGSLSPAVVHKLLQQQPSVQPYAPQPNTAQNSFGSQSGRSGQGNFPSSAQVRHLVQQIQMAVQAGHLNAQVINILHQPLAPQTLQYLYQLLQQIQVLSQLQQQQIYQSQHMTKPVLGGQNNNGLQLNVQVTQTKQRILNLQNQIAAQQAVFLKSQLPHPPQPPQQQQQQQQPPQQPPLQMTAPPPGPTDAFKPNMEAMPALNSEFRDLSIKEAPGQNLQSRLNQWKLPTYDKDEGSDSNTNSSNGGSFGNDFSRAPGPQPSKPTASTPSSMPNSTQNLHPLLSQGDNAWSSLSHSHTNSGWPDSIATSAPSDSSPTSGNPAATSMMGSGQPSELKDPAAPTTSGSSISSGSHSSYNLTDLVPEFEPGKPWKGTQLKSIEDDPHITPGSITRSPLSVNTIKDSNLFWNSKNSPSNSTNDGTGSLTSSTWGYNSQSPAPNSLNGQMKNGSKTNWGPMSSSDLVSGSDLWGSSSKSRGPPPGISSQGWDNQACTFLILRNLTPQIDGSTLKTLCMQHGPLQMFHLSLNRGVALVRYSTREEASKAQSALNNCVLGNTTMLADFPTESEIQQHLQLSSGQAAGNNGSSWSSTQQSGGSSSSFPASGNNGSYFGSSYGGNKEAPNWNGPMPASQLWSFSNSSLWGNSQSASEHDQSTNPINSYLPGDLLGGDAM